MAEVIFEPLNAVHAQIKTSPDVRAELRDCFTFEVPGARFSKLYKAGVWDGTIKLFKDGKLYVGLYDKLQRLCESRGYPYSIPDIKQPGLTDEQVLEFINGLDIPDKFERRDYQLETIKIATQNPRAIFLSPTASGKSFMIYNIFRYHNKKTLLIVPRESLLYQMASDFVDYGYDPDMIHTISSGAEKWSDKPITIALWQSAVKMINEPDWWNQFGMIIGDEAHTFAAKSLVTIMESLTECHYRYGFTGSLDESKCNAMVLEGLFGPVHVVTTTRELMDAGHVSDLAVNVLILKHPAPACKVKRKYQEEVDYLIGSPERNQFLTELVLNLEGNTLLLFHRIDAHGKLLYEMLKDCGRPVYFVHGKVKGKDREVVRKQIEDDENAILIASVGTFSVGVNIKRLHNIITASSWKSRVMNLQSIGRGLRLGSDKTICNLYDVVDDLSWKKRKNYVLQHGEHRIKLYAEQQFDYTVHKIEL